MDTGPTDIPVTEPDTRMMSIFLLSLDCEQPAPIIGYRVPGGRPPVPAPSLAGDAPGRPPPSTSLTGARSPPLPPSLPPRAQKIPGGTTQASVPTQLTQRSPLTSALRARGRGPPADTCPLSPAPGRGGPQRLSAPVRTPAQSLGPEDGL